MFLLGLNSGCHDETGMDLYNITKKVSVRSFGPSLSLSTNLRSLCLTMENLKAK